MAGKGKILQPRPEGWNRDAPNILVMPRRGEGSDWTFFVLGVGGSSWMGASCVYSFKVCHTARSQWYLSGPSLCGLPSHGVELISLTQLHVPTTPLNDQSCTGAALACIALPCLAFPACTFSLTVCALQWSEHTQDIVEGFTAVLMITINHSWVKIIHGGKGNRRLKHTVFSVLVKHKAEIQNV